MNVKIANFSSPVTGACGMDFHIADNYNPAELSGKVISYLVMNDVKPSIATDIASRLVPASLAEVLNWWTPTYSHTLTKGLNHRQAVMLGMWGAISIEFPYLETYDAENDVCKTYIAREEKIT